jgi:hypothetical protein
MPGDISFNFAQLPLVKTLDREDERIRSAVVKSFNRKLTPIAAGLISSSCAKLAGPVKDSINKTAKIFFISR